MRVLMITSEWPTEKNPNDVPFICQEVEALRNRGVEVDIFSFRGKKNIFNYIIAWCNLRKKHELDRYDLIHAQFGQSALLAFPAKNPLVITFRGSDLQGYIDHKGRKAFLGRVLCLISRWVAGKATEIIVVSDHLRSYLLLTHRVHTIPSGVDTSLFVPMDKRTARMKCDFPDDAKLILFSGNPANPLKRYSLAEKAVKILMKDMRIKLIVADGIDHKKQMPSLMNACDALLVTSCQEGSPNMVKEALACDLPVVSVDVGDVRTRLEKVPYCYVASDDKPETLATCLRKSLGEDKKESLREHILDLNMESTCKKIISVYSLALKHA